jgi:2-keto-4-pentenoate hydratase/2-oxohepta-3-ene-1,7-dioic acid hydratase in catechol pathway
MKLANVSIAERRALVVAGPDASILDVGRLLGRDHPDMDAVLGEGAELLDTITAKLAEAIPVAAVLDVAGARWLPPSPRPSKIVGVAVNNRSIAQFTHRPPEEPAYFLKPPSALVGHGEAIVVPAKFGLTHPEPELAAVIGRRSRNLTLQSALDAVLGFTIINDITSPALKDRDSMEISPPFATFGSDSAWRQVRGDEDHSVYLTYHARSKGCDTFAPMGPWLVTTDTVGDPNALDVRCWLDGELVLTDSTRNLTFSIEAVLAHLTSYMTLEAGDVVHFGTAVKAAAPQRFPTIRHLDISRIDGTLSVEIEGIGRLDNPIARQ